MSATYTDGHEAKKGDYIRFSLDGEIHFGTVSEVRQNGTIDVTRVIHEPKAVEHNVDASVATLAHRHKED